MSFLYQFSRALSRAFRAGMFDYCNLEVPDGDGESNIFGTKDNGMCTVFRIAGNYMHVGPDGLKESIRTILERLEDTIWSPGVRIDVIYIRDKKRANRVINKSLGSMRKTTSRLKMDLSPFQDEAEQDLLSRVVVEEVYLVLNTTLDALPKDNHKEAFKAREKKSKETGMPISFGEFCQNPGLVVAELRSTHESNLDSIKHAFSGACKIDALTVREAVKVIRFETAPDYTSDNWEPRLPGDQIPIRMIRESKDAGDLSHIGHPSIGYQLFPTQPSIHPEDASFVQVGDSVQAPLMVDLLPRDHKAFSEFDASLPPDTPVRLVFTLETGHERIVERANTRRNAGIFLSMASGQSKAVAKAAKDIIEMATNDHHPETFINVTMTACTWGDSIKEARRNRRSLAKSLQNWGGIDIVEEKADAIQAWATTLPTFSQKEIRIANVCPYPARWLAEMLPLDRAFSPFDHGSLLLTTLNQNLFPVQTGSSIQPAWFDYVFGGSGSGKSVMLAIQNLAYIQSHRNADIPLLSVIDIGPNAHMLIDIIKTALPEGKQHLATSHTLQNTKAFAINFMDTHLGCRYPIANQKQAIDNIMALALKPTGMGGKDIARLGEFASSLASRMYAFYDDDNNPKKFSPHLDSEIDKELERLSVDVDSQTTWWEVVDSLAALRSYNLAYKAQRYAVPCLKDATTVISEDPTLKNFFGKAATGLADEKMIDFANQQLSSVTQSLPMISNPTAFKIGEAKIIALDLNEVTKDGGTEKDKKQSAIMYLLARHVLTQNFYLKEAILDQFPPEYRSYHKARIKEYELTPKRLTMDEVHRGLSHKQMRNQLMVDGRENRKFGIQVALGSQYITDLKDPEPNSTASDLNKIITTFYIMGLGTDSEGDKEIKESLGISRETFVAMRKHMRGAGSKGVNFLVRMRLRGQDSSYLEHMANLRLGPGTLYSLSTTDEDMKLRAALSERVGLLSAIKIARAAFPEGGSQDFVRERISSGDYDGQMQDIYSILARDLISRYQSEVAKQTT